MHIHASTRTYSYVGGYRIHALPQQVEYAEAHHDIVDHVSIVANAWQGHGEGLRNIEGIYASTKVTDPVKKCQR